MGEPSLALHTCQSSQRLRLQQEALAQPLPLSCEPPDQASSVQKIQVGLGKAEGQRRQPACCEDRLSLKDTETLYMCPLIGTRGTGAKAIIINAWTSHAESTGIGLTPGVSTLARRRVACGTALHLPSYRVESKAQVFRHLRRSQTAQPLSTSVRQMGKGHLVGGSGWIQKRHHDVTKCWDRPLRSHGGPPRGSSKQQQAHLGKGESQGPGSHSSFTSSGLQNSCTQ